MSNNIIWTSYGRFIFDRSGDDATARKIISNCDWHVHNNHNGGEGDTLQVASPDEDVILVWAFNNFSGFKVSGAWSGHTDNFIELGSAITDLYATEPQFMTNDGAIHTLSLGEDINVSVTSDINGFIDEMTIGFYFRD